MSNMHEIKCSSPFCFATVRNGSYAYLLVVWLFDLHPEHLAWFVAYCFLLAYRDAVIDA